ncbi:MULTISPECIES: hypothetical protein [Lonsdalea]|uniref:hypothetical protein n=1 Tax=Lonsdalea TaxID=1082702 RepID=UPI000A1FB1E4|nr:MULTISPECIES: hypothetical protein [Lonsdalea]OSM94669.1 hypothetical protein AU499_16165 [Lonsdalea populi]OSN02508.1 hypothetical protein AU510_16830 [Lonsdalea britannica]QPQ23763.1 hypothetical protein I6N93_14365 [Lonsdalea populi]RAT40489.1 hypothetical protein AU494_15100 [Lonsdalea populi]RAT52481.1 hypothetical protein AU500_15085 [Lonsdalea populi]
MKVRDFEDKVWETEGVRIVIHAKEDTQVSEYEYKKAADASWRITELAQKRIDKHLDGNTFTVIQGDGEEPNGRVILRTIRSSYNIK